MDYYARARLEASRSRQRRSKVATDPFHGGMGQGSNPIGDREEKARRFNTCIAGNATAKKMKRYKCELCPFATDDLDEMRQHLDSSHDREAIVNPFMDRGTPGLEGIPRRVYRITPRSMRIRDMLKARRDG